jgi:chromosome segregation ATPase
MASRKKPPRQTAAGAHQFAVVAEELRGQFKVFGEALQSFREHVDSRLDEVDRRFEQIDRRFEQIDRRFERIDRRFERVEHEIGLLKDAALEHGRELKKHGQQLEELRAAVERKVDRNEVEAIVERAVAGSRAP